MLVSIILLIVKEYMKCEGVSHIVVAIIVITDIRLLLLLLLLH